MKRFFIIMIAACEQVMHANVAGQSDSWIQQVKMWWNGISPMAQKGILFVLIALLIYWLYAMACCKSSECTMNNQQDCDECDCGCVNCNCNKKQK